MNAVRNELQIPISLYSEKGAREVGRIWSTRNGQVFVLNAQVWDDPAAWGLVLADLARHAARAYAESSHEWNEKEALVRIKQLFDAEWSHPTD